MKKNHKVQILFATSVADERERFLDLVGFKKLEYRLVFPRSCEEAKTLIMDKAINLIISDLAFGDSSFVETLELWPKPLIILAYAGEEQKVDGLIQDETSSFLIRDAGYHYLGALPTMIHKVLNIRESLDRLNSHLQISERQYRDLVEAIPDIVYTVDDDGRIVFVNSSIYRLGYTPDEVIGLNLVKLVEAVDGKKLEDFKQNPDHPIEVRLCVKNDSAKTETASYLYGELLYAWLAAAEYEGGAHNSVGIIRDITERKKAERRLEDDLRSKDTLLREIHHRVKNNLQIVSSLLSLQGSRLDDADARSIFNDCQTQIQSIAMVHERLYRSVDLRNVNIGAYLSGLVAHLINAYEQEDKPPNFILSCSVDVLPIDQAIPLALVANELIARILKKRRVELDSTLRVEMSEDTVAGYYFALMFEGDPELVFTEKVRGEAAFQMVEALCGQLGAELKIGGADRVEFSLRFPSREQDLSGQF